MRSKLKWFYLLLLCIKLLYENCLRKSVYTNCRSKFYKWQHKLELISHYEYMKRNPCAVYWFHNKRDDSGIASVYVGKIGFNIITYTVFVHHIQYFSFKKFMWFWTFIQYLYHTDSNIIEQNVVDYLILTES